MLKVLLNPLRVLYTPSSSKKLFIQQIFIKTCYLLGKDCTECKVVEDVVPACSEVHTQGRNLENPALGINISFSGELP